MQKKKRLLSLYLHRKSSKQLMKTVIITIILVLVSVLLLGVKVLFVKGSTFPSGHVGHSAALRKRGIGCASEEESPRVKP